MVYKILSRTAILFLVLTSVLFLLLLHTTIYNANKKLDDVNYLLSKKEIYSVITNEEICSIYDCELLHRFNQTYFFDKGDLKRSIYGKINFIQLYDVLYFETDTLSVFIKVEDAFLRINILEQLEEHINLFIIYIPLMLLVFFVFIYRLMEDEMLYAMIHKSKIVNDMEIMTAIRVGENTAHEIRTPLDVVTSKLFKIRETLNGYVETERIYLNKISTIPPDRRNRNTQLSNLEQDFNLVEMSLTHISDQVDKMSGYKNLLHSNGNKNLHDIIDFARRSMVMGHDNLSIVIDNNFTKYGISGMKNSELLGIFINHFKNSIEANSSHIDINILNYKEGFITLTIADNGNGIPEEIRPYIFESGRSTKQKIGPNEVIRGHGMFNNKVLITKLGGDIILDRRYRDGTMFIMKLPIYLKKNNIVEGNIHTGI